MGGRKEIKISFLEVFERGLYFHNITIFFGILQNDIYDFIFWEKFRYLFCGVK